MSWILELQDTNPVAQAIAILAFVCVLGMSLGGIRLPTASSWGTAGLRGDPLSAITPGRSIMPLWSSSKNFGLILFVFCIGLQLGARIICPHYA